MKLIEVQAAKEFASTFLNDIFFKMAVNRVLDAAPGFDLVRCGECKHARTDRIGCIYCAMWDVWEMPETGYCHKGERNANERDFEIIMTLAKNNMRATETAYDLDVHRNTVLFRIGKIKRITGLDPQNFYDLHKLVEMVRKEMQ